MKMKLYVWDDVLRDWTSGIMFAVAPDVKSAREQILKADPNVPSEDLAKRPSVFQLTSPRAFTCWGGG